MPDRIRVLLVDSPALIRQCLSLLLGRKRRLEIVGEAGSRREALDQVASLSPDVVLVDPAVPDGGPSLVAELCTQAPDTAVVVLTGTASEGSVARMLQQGVRGYLEKSCDLAAVVQCVERVNTGEVVIARSLSGSLPCDFETYRDGAASALSSREREVLSLVADGRTNGEIARDLYITEHTVKSHLARILSKLRLDNRVQLATYATQLNLFAGADPARA
jgi:two-component system, NarL family, response regulator DevR